MRLLETVELRDGDLGVDVLPARGLDLGAARFRGERFSWESPLGHIPWQGDFARSFGGGLLVTCGLRNVGVPSEGQPQHGWHSSLPAREVIVERRSARGRVLDAEVPGPALELSREVRVDGGSLTVTDVVRNLGREREPAPLLYHVNVLWDDVDIVVSPTLALPPVELSLKSVSPPPPKLTVLALFVIVALAAVELALKRIVPPSVELAVPPLLVIAALPALAVS